MTISFDTGGSYFGHHKPAEVSMLPELSSLGESPLYQTRQLRLADTQTFGRLGNYHIIGHFQGGMSDVYLCLRDIEEPQPPIAFKSFSTRLGFDPIARRAFNRECAIWARASLVPGVLPFWGLEEIEGRRFIAMQGVLPGPKDEITLRDVIARGTPSMELVVFFARVIADSLNRAARVVPGLVHGDLKPSNLLMMWGNVPLIGDFGIARTARYGLRGDALPGTRAYCSPLAQDPRAELSVLDDVYSYGVILEELLVRGARKSRRTKNTPRGSAVSSTSKVRSDLLTLARQCSAVDPSQRPPDFSAIGSQLDLIAPEDQWPIPDEVERIPHPTVSQNRLGFVAQTLVSLHEFDATLEFIASTQSQTRSSELWLLQGFAFTEIGKTVKARTSFRKARVLREKQEDEPESRSRDLGRINYGYAMTHGKSSPRKAARLLRRLVAESCDPIVADTALYSLGAIYADLGRLREAERIYLELAAKQGDDVLIWNQLGTLYIRLEECGRAVEAYQRAIRLSRFDPRFHCGLGQALTKIPGRADEAMRAFDDAVNCGDLSRDTFTFALVAAYMVNDLAKIMRWNLLIVRYFGNEAPKINKIAINAAICLKKGSLPTFHRARRDRRWERRHAPKPE